MRRIRWWQMADRFHMSNLLLQGQIYVSNLQPQFFEDSDSEAIEFRGELRPRSSDELRPRMEALLQSHGCSGFIFEYVLFVFQFLVSR
ncbi:hypothetical protein ACS0TY_034512 [Phlomoides rotata]